MSATLELAREPVRGPASAGHGGEARAEARLDAAIDAGREALLGHQQDDGHWCFELESDATITAEYILMMHFADEIDTDLQARMAVYLRAIQRRDRHGGWDQYHDGALDISCSVKAYFALKAAGDAADAPHMVQAREAILAAGGAARANVFTRILLATFEQVPWRATPFVPVELILFPRWMPVHLDKMAYWARSTLVPLTVLCSMRAKAANPHRVSIRELFVTPPEEERRYFSTQGLVRKAFLVVDRLARCIEPMIPAGLRRRAIERAQAWCVERMNGEDGLGGIFPPMVYWYEMMVLLGIPKSDPRRATCLAAIRKLVVHRPDGMAYCQPCLSPVWDTAWSIMALQHAGGGERTRDAIQRAYDWLAQRQVQDLRGDWADHVPATVQPGGWAFQYANPYYPDIDDSAVVAAMLAVHGRRLGQPERYAQQVERAVEWMVGLQSRNGGFGAFDANCDREYLNRIPFADHGALLDPPTEDVSGRVLLALGLSGERARHADAVARCVDYLRRTQRADGSWWGRWGTNYLYGTWSVLAGLALVGEDVRQPYIRKAVDWLLRVQNADGGWGETNDTYFAPHLAGTNGGESTPNCTAWALLALFAVGEAHAPAARRGIDYLLGCQQKGGLWWHPSHNAPGFPRIYYLKYHGYTAYFPLWALTRYRQLVKPVLPRAAH
ncbi:squalene--hopene cyclase [Cupriavidus sp. USMAA2-4]|uniref:squalene--hopene cyclase n=1 Tax=Cupriavidus sp. USMAA2-4 TaxID=876364 RepID=UPI0009FD279F|nr:squalene--hopene cyclase [Cupriavidus sp. USMAA2-4]